MIGVGTSIRHRTQSRDGARCIISVRHIVNVRVRPIYFLLFVLDVLFSQSLIRAAIVLGLE